MTKITKNKGKEGKSFKNNKNSKQNLNKTTEGKIKKPKNDAKLSKKIKQKKEIFKKEVVNEEKNLENDKTVENSLNKLLTKKEKLKQKKEKKKQIAKDNATDQKSSNPEENGSENDMNNEKASLKKEPHPYEQSSNTLFVGNIPANTKKIQLKKLVEPFGKVISVRMRTVDGKILFKHKARKDAAALNGYVVMENKDDVEKALALNGTEFKGKVLRVNKAEKDKNGQENSDPRRTIFVGNLKASTTDENLHEIFNTCGEIEYVRTLQNDKGCNGAAYVCFKNVDSVNLALELSNTVVRDRAIRVERYSMVKLGANFRRSLIPGKEIKGAEKRINDKNKKFKGNTKHQQDGKYEKKSNAKKSEFHGVKIDKMKKPKNKTFKKKLSQSEMLSKKIAPKPVGK